MKVVWEEEVPEQIQEKEPPRTPRTFIRKTDVVLEHKEYREGNYLYRSICPSVDCGHITYWCFNRLGALETIYRHIDVEHNSPRGRGKR